MVHRETPIESLETGRNYSSYTTYVSMAQRSLAPERPLFNPLPAQPKLTSSMAPLKTHTFIYFFVFLAKKVVATARITSYTTL